MTTWAVYGPDLAVEWDGQTSNRLVIYPDSFDSGMLDGRFGRIVPPCANAYVTVITPEASSPTRTEIQEAWTRTADARRREMERVDCRPRLTDETQRQFGERVAHAYQVLQLATGRPTDAMLRRVRRIKGRENTAKQTVGRWVRDARIMGLLPESTHYRRERT